MDGKEAIEILHHWASLWNVGKPHDNYADVSESSRSYLATLVSDNAALRAELDATVPRWADLERLREAVALEHAEYKLRGESIRYGQLREQTFALSRALEEKS